MIRNLGKCPNGSFFFYINYVTLRRLGYACTRIKDTHTQDLTNTSLFS